MSSDARRAKYYLALLCLALSFYWGDFLLNTRSFYFGDISFFFEPLLSFICHCLKQGQLPLWNPLSYCGMPQVAIPSPGIFYPFTYLFAVLPFNSALASIMLFHQMVAAAGFFLLVESLGWGLMAAAVASMGYALCGYMFCLQTNYTLVATASWLPLLVFAGWRIGPSFTLRNAAYVAALAAVTALTILSGRPEVFVLGLAAATTVIFAQALTSHKDKRWSACAWRALAIVLGVMLAAPLIGPSLEWAALSPRSHGFDLQETLRWSANWYHIASMFIAQPLSDVSATQAQYLSLMPDFQGFAPYVTSSYLGPIVITLALWGILDHHWRWRWHTLAALLATLALCLGSNTPLLPSMLQALPSLAVIRYPSKMLIIPLGIICIMAARGAYVLEEKRANQVCLMASLAFWAIVLGASAFLLVHGPGPDALVAILTGNASPLAREASFSFAHESLWAAIIALAACFAFNAYANERFKERALLAIVIFLQAWTMLSSAYLFKQSTATGYFAATGPVVEKLKELCQSDQMAGQQFRFLPAYTLLKPPPAAFSKSSIWQEDACLHQYNRTILHPNSHLDNLLASSFGYETAETGDYKECFLAVIRQFNMMRAPTPDNQPPAQSKIDDTALANFMRITATKYILTQPASMTRGGLYAPPPPAADLFQNVYTNQALNIQIHALNNCPARAYLASSLRSIDSQALANEYLSEKAKPLPVAQTAFLSAADAAAIGKELLAGGQADEGSGTVLWHIDRANDIELEVNCSHFALLILTDHIYPGWTATVDGQPAKIYRANIFNRAVPVPAGKHTVTFHYAPASLQLGLIVWLIAMLVLLALILAARAKSKPS